MTAAGSGRRPVGSRHRRVLAGRLRPRVRGEEMAMAPPTAPPVPVGGDRKRRAQGEADPALPRRPGRHHRDGGGADPAGAVAGVGARRRCRWSSASPGGRASAASTRINWIGVENYKNIFTIYPPFQPAIQHNLIWLAVLFLVPTPLGIFLAVLLDKEMRGSRFYQTAFFLPVVLSLALVGLHVAAHLLAGAGPAQPDHRRHDRLVRRPERQPVGRAGRGLLEADRLRHAALPGRAEGRRPDAARGRDGRRRQRRRRRSSGSSSR